MNIFDYVIGNSKHPAMNYFQYNYKGNKSTRYCALDIRSSESSSWDILISQPESSLYNVMADVTNIASLAFYFMQQAGIAKDEKLISWYLLKMQGLKRDNTSISELKLYKAILKYKHLEFHDPRINEIQLVNSVFNLDLFMDKENAGEKNVES